jgi:hypothetical protein
MGRGGPERVLCERGCGGISSELYDLLCTVVKGEGWTILKSVEEFYGFKAWQKLQSKYNPRTAARAFELLSDVCSPGAVEGAHEVEAAFATWRAEVRVFEREFDERLGERMNIAIMTSMMPPSVQDHFSQTFDDKTSFQEMLARVGS